MRALVGLATSFYLLSTAAYAQTSSPTPAPSSGGVVSMVAQVFSLAATWLGARALEYGGSPLLPTVAAVLLIVLFVALMAWLRRPRKPLDTEVPV